MKPIKAIALLVIFAVGLPIPTQAQSTLTVEIMPPEPTSVDGISVAVKVIHSCSIVSFSDLQFFSWSRVFFATVFEEPVICLDLEEPPKESTHTYHLGKLVPGRYEFQLQYCTPRREPQQPVECSVGTEEFQVTEASIERITDRNSNGVIDDDEILWAINLWIAGVVVPGATKTIDDATILGLIDLWIRQTPIVH